MHGVRIVSGGQSGVDRAALDAALALGLEAGGWCPRGRLAEDGPIPDHYPLREMPGPGYRQRTLRNVIDSDGTLIVYFGYLSGGTELTVSFCMQRKRPYVLIDGNELSEERAAQKIGRFIRQRGIRVLNVAGPRASGEPRAYDYTRHALAILFQG
ncbi:MAG: putative molybdenum carrier protein [Candidatus Sedimenticola endophacoides]